MFKTVSILAILCAAVLSTGCAITPPTADELARYEARDANRCSVIQRCQSLSGKGLERAQTDARASAANMPAPKAFR